MLLSVKKEKGKKKKKKTEQGQQTLPQKPCSLKCPSAMQSHLSQRARSVCVCVSVCLSPCEPISFLLSFFIRFMWAFLGFYFYFLCFCLPRSELSPQTANPEDLLFPFPFIAFPHYCLSLSRSPSLFLSLSLSRLRRLLCSLSVRLRC